MKTMIIETIVLLTLCVVGYTAIVLISAHFGG